MAKIAICYFLHKRNYEDIFFEILKKVDKKLLDKCELHILSSKNISYRTLKQLYCYHRIFRKDINYSKKLQYIAERIKTRYIIKIDDDCLLSPNTWEFLIKNIDKLDEKDVLFLTPLISNGIPHCNYFIEDFWGKESIEYKLLTELMGLTIHRQHKFSHCLNRQTIESEKDWQYIDYYENWINSKHYQKNRLLNEHVVSPLHHNIYVQQTLNWLIIRDIDRFFNNKPNQFILLPKYNFASTCFAIKRKDFNKIITNTIKQNREYEQDILNKEWSTNDLRVYTIQNGYCFHGMYKWGRRTQRKVYHIQNDKKYDRLESEIFDEFRKYLNES